jgi:diaminohydroxyphosphoribosylaminopyrimidine deaminase/5-amino-6-(5-phosphoribosylamino)uracil reductase
VADLPLVVVCSRAASRTSVQALEAAGVDVIVAAGENEAARVRSGLVELGTREVQSLLLEGGPHLAGAFFDAGEVDELRLFVAPIVAGGRSARAAVEGQGIEQIGSARRALTLTTERIADDVLISARLSEW